MCVPKHEEFDFKVDDIFFPDDFDDDDDDEDYDDYNSDDESDANIDEDMEIPPLEIVVEPTEEAASSEQQSPDQSPEHQELLAHLAYRMAVLEIRAQLHASLL